MTRTTLSTPPPHLPRDLGPTSADHEASPAIRTEDLTRVFKIPGRHAWVNALSGVSISLPRESFTAIVGASGSGKSTLLQCIAGLDQPTAGRVELLGIETAGLKPRARAAHRAATVGFIFQDDNLVSSLSARDNVALPGRLRHHPLPADEVTAALTRVGLADQARHLPRQMSGGERQRVAIARVLASRPALVFADEPTAALDLVAGMKVLDWLDEARHAGSTILMVTHDAGAASRADEVMVMDDGRLVGRVPGGDAGAVADAVLRARSVTSVGHAPTASDQDASASDHPGAPTTPGASS